MPFSVFLRYIRQQAPNSPDQTCSRRTRPNIEFPTFATKKFAQPRYFIVLSLKLISTLEISDGG